MKNEKKKGGKRPGSGRRPNEVKKEPITVYTDVSKFGGKEGARIAIYKFLDGEIADTGTRSFMPIELPKKKSTPVAPLKPKVQSKIKIQPLINPEAPMVTKGAPKTLDELKALCPYPEKSEERSQWIRTERPKYGI